MHFFKKIETKKGTAETVPLTIVRMRRLELLLLSEPDPKSGAATNYATPARKLRGKNTIFLRMEVPDNLKKSVLLPDRTS